MTSHQINSKNTEQYIVGLTGNICSGKSKAAEYFGELRIETIDLDEVVDNIYKKNVPLRYKLYKEFGYKIFNKKLEVNKQKLGKIIFADKQRKKKLENIVWPYAKKEREKMTMNKKGIIIVESAMLYESGLDDEFDINILIAVDEELQIKRLMKRNNFDRETALIRIQSQMSQIEKIMRSDYVIFNNGSLDSLKRKIEEAYEFLIKSFLHKKDLFTLE